MPEISVSGKLPGGDGNGLSAITQALIEEGRGDKPRALHLCLALVDCSKVVINGDTHETVPVARIRRIEVIVSVEDRKLAEDLMRRALESRTGHETLPYDLELELRDVMANADMTPEPDPEPVQEELPLGSPAEWDGSGEPPQPADPEPGEQMPDDNVLRPRFSGESADEDVAADHWPDDLSGLNDEERDNP